MSDERALLAAIRDAPDDLPHLAHADWLEEHGQSPRAGFVRVQIERARLPWDDDRQAPLQARERELLIEYGSDWLPGEVSIFNVRFRRGHVEEIHCDVETLKATLPLVEEWPVRSLGPAFSGRAVERWLSECPLLARVETLTLRNRYGTDYEPRLLASPRLRRLRHLKLDGCHPDTPAAVYARGDLTQRLESFDVNDLGFDWPAMPDLLAGAWPRLRRLWFAENSLDTQAVLTLMASDLWPQLDEIGLGDVAVGEPQRAALVAGLERMNATSIALPFPEGEFDLFGAVASASTWGRLRSLALFDQNVTADSLDRLLAHPGAANLTCLNVQASPQAWATATGPLPPGLLTLTAYYQDAFRLLVRSEHCRPIDVCAKGPEDDLVAFLGSPAASRLRRLTLGGEVNERVATAIASSPYLGRLTTLTSYPGPLRLSAARILARATNLPCLTFTRLAMPDPGAARVLLESPLRGWVSAGWEADRTDEGLAALIRARYRGINWGYLLDER